MLVRRYEPFNDIRRSFDLLNQIINSVETSRESATMLDFVPKVNTREDDKAYYIDLDLPGIKKDDINIDVTGTKTQFKQMDFNMNSNIAYFGLGYSF